MMIKRRELRPVLYPRLLGFEMYDWGVTTGGCVESRCAVGPGFSKPSLLALGAVLDVVTLFP